MAPEEALMQEEAEATAPEEELAQTGEEGDEILWSNRYGFFNGQRFCLRSFPVWYRWRQVPEEPEPSGAVGSTSGIERVGSSVAMRHADLSKLAAGETEEDAQARKVRFKTFDESGTSFGINWQQTLGRMELSCPLEGDGPGLSEEDLVVELSTWELRVSVRHYVEGLQRLDALCGELFGDVHRQLSWWRVYEDDGEGSGRWLHISLAKGTHKPWVGPWWLNPRNSRRRSKIFGLLQNSYPGCIQAGPGLNGEGGVELVAIPPGEPLDARRELLASLEPEGLCTGLDFEEDDQHSYVLVHLDEENLDRATSKVSLEELFGADVEEDRLEVFVNGVGYKICSGELAGLCVPEQTTWEVMKAVRRRLPRKSGIKAPAYYNPALRIKLVKADNAQGIWGGAYASMTGPDFRPPRERMSWTEIMQRALVLAPTAPLVAATKAAEAPKLCTSVECSQDVDSAFIIMHLHPRLELFAWQYKLDVGTFFAMRVTDRIVDMNVVADCEFSMCYGWLGGNCLPDRTSWELVKHERQEKATTVKVVAASGGGQRLTAPEAIAMCEELKAQFSAPNLRHRLRALEAELGQGTSAFRQERQRLVGCAQFRILPKYGFEASLSGVAEMSRCVREGELLENKVLRAIIEQADALLQTSVSNPLPDLVEDHRFLGTWLVEGRLHGKFEIAKDERSTLLITFSVLGLKMSGTLEPTKSPAREAATDSDVGPWLQAEVQTEDGRKKCAVRLRLDEATEKIVFDFRRLFANLDWVNGLTAGLESKVHEEKAEREAQEPHLAVHVRVTKAPDSRRRWRRVFLRTGPGVPAPADEEEDEADNLGGMGGEEGIEEGMGGEEGAAAVFAQSVPVPALDGAGAEGMGGEEGAPVVLAQSVLPPALA